MRTLRIAGKCSDFFDCEYTVDGKTILKHEGYAPEFEGLCGGDYIDFEVDLDTGQIVNWKPILEKEVIRVFKDESEDEDEDDIPEGFIEDADGNLVGIPKEELDASINKLLDEINFG